MISASAFVSKIIRHIIFPAVKNVSFPQSRNFSTINQLFHNRGNFPQSRDFSTINKLFHNQGIFYVMEIFHCQENFPQKNLLDRRNFLQSFPNFSPLDQVSFSQRFLHSQKKFLQTTIKKVL